MVNCRWLTVICLALVVLVVLFMGFGGLLGEQRKAGMGFGVLGFGVGRGMAIC